MRALRRAPRFAALAVAVLASGIGATTVMYTLARTVLLRALPFEDPERLVWMYNARTERDRAPLSLPDLDDYRREASTLAGLRVFTNWTTNLTGIGSPERLDGIRLSGNFFGLLGVDPLLGRLLQPEDEAREARVAVLTYGLWLRRFGGDAAILGQGVSLNGATYTVVGVLPPGFLFPFREAELAVPLALRTDPRRADRGANFLRVVARMAPGVTLKQSREDLNAIAHRLQRLYPDEDARKTGISLYPLQAEIVRDYRTMAHFRIASNQYFDAAGIHVLEGRTFDDRDRQDGQPVAIVSRTFAARHWPGEPAVGKSVQIVQAGGSPRLDIVGVVNDVKQFTLDAPPTADLYVPLHQMPAFQVPLIASRMYWVVRARGTTASTTHAIRSAVAQVDPEVAASSGRTLEAVWLASLGPRRAQVRVLQVFGDAALLLCALGVYGVAAFSARTRRRELAIRTALGATRRELTISMLRREMQPVLVGLAIGLAAALILAPVLFAGAFAINPHDSKTYALVTATLLGVAAVATYLPVRRAAGASPSGALSPD